MQMQPVIEKQPVDWTPIYERTGEAIRSLGVCSINLQKACAFEEQQKKDEYEDAWKNPAPARCRLRESEQPRATVPLHRMGSYVETCNR